MRARHTGIAYSSVCVCARTRSRVCVCTRPRKWIQQVTGRSALKNRTTKMRQYIPAHPLTRAHVCLPTHLGQRPKSVIKGANHWVHQVGPLEMGGEREGSRQCAHLNSNCISPLCASSDMMVVMVVGVVFLVVFAVAFVWVCVCLCQANQA